MSFLSNSFDNSGMYSRKGKITYQNDPIFKISKQILNRNPPPEKTKKIKFVDAIYLLVNLPTNNHIGIELRNKN